MILHRVVFHDKSTNEYYNTWHASKASAKKSSDKLIKDCITDKTFIDTKLLFGGGERDKYTVPLAVEFLNEHAMVNVDMADNDEIDWHESQFENDSLGG